MYVCMYVCIYIYIYILSGTRKRPRRVFFLSNRFLKLHPRLLFYHLFLLFSQIIKNISYCLLKLGKNPLSDWSSKEIL